MSAASFLFLLVFMPTLIYAQKNKKAPEWSKNATMYELNVRQFSKEGTFNAVIPELPRLKKMGIDIIWLMPIHPIGVKNRKGTLGSYYAVKDYKAVNPEFGDDKSFKELVDATHAAGMKIIIDWVANHSSPDNVWVEQGHKDWYTLDSAGNLQPTLGTDWWDVADLNYDNKEMRKAMIEAMEFWVKKFDIDGYRCDVAGWVPVDFWEEVRQALDKIKPIFMLAEDEGPHLHNAAFDVTYAWELHHVMNKVAQGKMNADSIVAYFDREKKRFPNHAYRLNFTSNHDENSWNGTEFERLGGGVEAFAVFGALSYGMPLIYNGQESSFNRRLKFFEKDQIDWGSYDKAVFYQKLFELKKNKSVLSNEQNGGFPVFMKTQNPNVLAFDRSNKSDHVVVIMNLSDKVQKAKISIGKTTVLKDFKTGKAIKLSAEHSLKLKPWQYLVYTN